MMLQALLKEIQSGGTLETRVLAARLGTTPQMVAAMLEHLERAGMLQNVQQQCAAADCHGCDLAGTCSPGKATGRVWRLGRRL